MLLRLFQILLFIGLPGYTIAQLPVANTTTSSIAITGYYQALGEQAPIYNGEEYIPLNIILREGHVFFGSDIFTKGSIWFDGMFFQDVPLLYDILKDRIIVQHYSHRYKINLASEKVGYFTLQGHQFVHLAADADGLIKDGFYESLYSGKTMLFAKRTKTISEDHSATEINNIVSEQSERYIKKDGRYYRIKNLHTFLDIFKSNRKEIQQHLNKNKIKYKNNPELAMIMAIEFYDRTTN